MASPLFGHFCLLSDCFDFVLIERRTNPDGIEPNATSEFDYRDAPLSHHVGNRPFGHSNVICDLFAIKQTALR